METLYQVVKMFFVVFFSISQLFAPKIAGGDFPPSAPVEPGDPAKYIQIETVDEGFDIYKPVHFGRYAGYRYGPSMILNASGSLDVWFASNGPGDYIDVTNYKRYSPDFKKSTKEVTALTPTAGTYDCDRVPCACDPGVIKFGGWYYIGYSSDRCCIARSRNPEGPFIEKWTGSGWGENPTRITGPKNGEFCIAASEPSFVLMGDTLFVYHTWWGEEGMETRVMTADATEENWPATLQEHGVCIPPRPAGDSADIKYSDEYGRFIAVYTDRRFSDNSYVAVWESFDGLTFRPSGFVKDNTCKKLHNVGLSARADGHIGKGDPVYLAYAYAGADNIDWPWATRMHKVNLSLADAPLTDTSIITRNDAVVTFRDISLVPEIIAVKAEHLTYTISKTEPFFVMAFDTDGFCFPLLTGVTFDGYDKSIVRVVGGLLIPVSPGTTRVTVHWHNFSDSFVVTVTE